MLAGVMVQLNEVMMTYRKSLISPSKATHFIESNLFVYICLVHDRMIFTFLSRETQMYVGTCR